MLLNIFICGLAFRGLLYVWQRSAYRWSAWFPLVRKALQALLVLGMAGLAGTTLYLLVTGGSEAGYAPALLVLGLGLVVPEAYARFRPGASDGEEDTKRGSEVSTPKDLARRLRAEKAKTDLVLGGVPIPVTAEPYHFLIAGATGTGKSVAINALLTRLRERGDTVILVDSGGDFLSKHFQADRDFVFNPYDERCVGWSPVLEMQGAWDAQALARSIVPDGVGDTREWNSYAQTFISSVLRRLWETKRLSLQDFLYYVQVAPLKELKELLEGTPSASQLASEKMFGSIRSIASNYLLSYDYLPRDQQDFSVTQMIQAEHSGMLFVTYRDDQLDSLRNIIACLLDVAARAVLSLNADPNRRVWLIIDEFASIGRVQSVEAVATKARKAGGCLVLGVQSISQLKDRYGDNGAQTILSCLSTWLVLRCTDADTAEYMSRYIGEAEVSRTQQGRTSGDTGDTSTTSEQRVTKRAVMASEVQAFANLHGMLKLAGGYPVCEVNLSFPRLPKEAGGAAFESRDFERRPLLALKATGTDTLPAFANITPEPAAPPPVPEVGAELRPLPASLQRAVQTRSHIPATAAKPSPSRVQPSRAAPRAPLKQNATSESSSASFELPAILAAFTKAPASSAAAPAWPSGSPDVPPPAPKQVPAPPPAAALEGSSSASAATPTRNKATGPSPSAAQSATSPAGPNDRRGRGRRGRRSGPSLDEIRGLLD